MSNSLDQKVKKLYAARSKREAELHAIHEDILHCINSQSKQVKVERLVTKCNEAFMTVVDKVMIKSHSRKRRLQELERHSRNSTKNLRAQSQLRDTYVITRPNTHSKRS